MIDQWRRLLGEANELMENHEYEKAQATIERVRDETTAAGLDSGQVHWMLGVALDNQADLQGALVEFERATTLDPLMPGFFRSRDIVLGRLGEMLRGVLPALDDRARVECYDRLVERGRAEVDDHLAAVKLLRLVGDVERATQVASGLTALFPLETRGWAACAELAEARGDEPAAADARRGLEAAKAAQRRGPWRRPTLMN